MQLREIELLWNLTCFLTCILYSKTVAERLGIHRPAVRKMRLSLKNKHTNKTKTKTKTKPNQTKRKQKPNESLDMLLNDGRVLPIKDMSVQISDITVWCRIFWESSSSVHSSQEKYTATSSKDKQSWTVQQKVEIIWILLVRYSWYPYVIPTELPTSEGTRLWTYSTDS